jgi:RNA polymerase sigma-70 factor (ECF subfamily)
MFVRDRLHEGRAAVRVGAPEQGQEPEEVVREAQRGDGDALATLYDTYVRRIYRYVLLRVRDTAEAEDLTEQVFVKMLESLRSYQASRAPFSAWLFRIAHNLTVDFERKRRSRARYVLLQAPLLSSEDPGDLAMLHIQSEQVLEAVKDLPEAQRQVIALRFGGQHSTAEVARIMARSEAAVKSLQYKAIQTLRQVLGGVEVVHEPS